MFFYGDHWGSANWITDCGRHPIQYLHYLPYGQLIANQQATYYASGVPMAENLGPDVPQSQYNALGVQYTENFGRDEQPYLYNGKEFVEAHGLNEYDSQARRYYAPIMRTTTMDPLAENYYHISPYAWCGNNPVTNIDVTGSKYKVVTRNDTKIITAKIYTTRKSKKSAQKSADFWNKQKGKRYTSKNGKVYDVIFDIKVVEVKDEETAHNEAADDKIGNSYKIGINPKAKPTKKGRVVNGTTDSDTRSHIEVREERAYTTTGAHEIGHVLGLDHTDEGIMTPTPNDPKRTDEVTQENIDQIILNDQKKHPIKTISEKIIEQNDEKKKHKK